MKGARDDIESSTVNEAIMIDSDRRLRVRLG